MTITANALTGADWFKSSYSNNQGGNCVEGARLDADWFKSSYSNDQGGNCLEGGRIAADWFKSTYSNDQGGECVEGAFLEDGAMAVRDSKDPDGPALIFTVDAWHAFTGAVKRGEMPAA
jgi:hypothetical protein